MENSAHTWRLKIFKLVFVYAHRLFCYPPAQKKFFARAKNFFLSPQSSGSRTGGYLLSCPTLCKHWRLDFLSQPPFFSNFSIPAALAAHRYSWPPMTPGLSKEFDTRRHRKRLQLQSRQLYFRRKQKLLKSQLRGRSWPILYIIVFLGVVWITVLVFCQFKQKIGKKSPFFFINQLIFYP